MKILLIGHSCSPVHGSEPGITWSWAWELAALHDVHLLAHPEHRAETERFLASHPERSLQVHWVELPGWVDPWKPFGRRRWVRLHYLIWRRKAFHEAVKLNKIYRFDLVHHIGWMTVSAPPLTWKLGVPFVWGPVGGGQKVPEGFVRYTTGNRIDHALRVVRMRLLPFLPSLRSAVRHASLIFVTNEETQRILLRAGARHVELMIDAGVPPSAIPPEFPERPVHSNLTVLWASRFEPRKAFPLALEALERTSDPSIHLHVVGDGPMEATWTALTRHMGLKDRVRFVGRRPWPEMWSIFAASDVFLFTSLNDTFGSVVAEAMSQGLPVLTLAHQGVGHFVPDEAGIKVPVTSPDKTVRALADALDFLAAHPDVRRNMGYSAWSYAQTISWTKKAQQMTRRYEDVLRSPAGTPRRHAFPLTERVSKKREGVLRAPFAEE